LHALDHRTDALHHVAGDGDSFGARGFGVLGAAHTVHIFLGNGDAQLVHHELGVAETGERPDAGDQRQLVMPGALETLREDRDRRPVA